MSDYNHSGRVHSKNVYVTIEAPADRERLLNMTNDEFPFENGIVADEGGSLLIHNQSKTINLRKGMKSLMKKMKFNEAPTLVATRNLPESYLQLFQSQITDAVKFGRFTSQKYIDKFLDKIEQRAKKRNADTVNDAMLYGVAHCVKEGIIPANMMSAYEQVTKRLKMEGTDEIAASKELPNGKNLVIFDRRNIRREFRSFKGESFNTKLVRFDNGTDIISMTVGTANIDRKKHYWLFSKVGGFGKTAILDHFKLGTNCSEITDVRNMINVSPTAQFIIIDEYGDQPGTNKCFPFVDFKEITNGDASHYEGNCKSFGAGRSFRSDAQLIITSNYHPFHVYGKYDQKLQKRFIDPAVADTIRQRLIIMKFDEPGRTVYNRDGSHIVNGLSLEDDEKTYFRSNYIEGNIRLEPEIVYDSREVAAARCARIETIMAVDLKNSIDDYYQHVGDSSISFELADPDSKLIDAFEELVELDLVNASRERVKHYVTGEAYSRGFPQGSQAMIDQLCLVYDRVGRREHNYNRISNEDDIYFADDDEEEES